MNPKHDKLLSSIGFSFGLDWNLCHYGKDICARLKEVLPRQLFEVAIQAAVGKAPLITL